MKARGGATIEDLYHVPENGKAELVNGKLVFIPPTGMLPNYAAGEVFISLREYALRTKLGHAVTDNAAFIVNLPHRKSFSPSAGFFKGQEMDMKFVEGAPLFAVEVRSEDGYGPAAERKIARKISDYLAAGTQVVWDVDLLSEDVVRVHRADSPERVGIYRRGQLAEAGPALPGWSMPVDDLFPE
ncbi:MAG TPA: Uma2 family endonuclease [Chloroflexia bacterium]|jgi:Uma2 family endonuclease|nr:Uma2 family endonuclease [Chloroflexia bacterium]